MRQLVSTLVVVVLTLAFAMDDAEARRLGGARSIGTQRSSVTPSRSLQPTPPTQAAAAAPAASPTAAAPKPAGNRWLGPIAGLAAGLGLGWLIGQGGFGGMMGTVLLMALLGIAVVFVLRLFNRPRTEGNLQYAGMSSQPEAIPALAPAAGAPDFGAQLRPSIPAGFDSEGFLRQARLNFVRLQAAHDSGKLDELREFTTDEMFDSIRRDVQERGTSAQQTDVVTLNAELLEVLTEGDSHWASVRFSGLIRETRDGQPEGFEEVWNLAKPASGATGWVLAGIQQLQ